MNSVPVTIQQRQVPGGVNLDADIPDLLSRIYLSRDISSTEELDYSLKHLPSPVMMKGMEDAIASFMTETKRSQANLPIWRKSTLEE